ncbi:unnamed protein product [Adineta ricciae]|uniref:Thioredoxin domain-containing protein n=1 Tax=Adineta ricciae TaxID=249248 RepID=A0A814U8S9_ADIRI|nr:unnamed protein product [Adineta ricciae]CAF1170650.1 unnamed protein product [Adineta ricciae]
MSARGLQTVVRNVQNLWLINNRRQFQTSALRLADNVIHVKDDADFQKRVLQSKNPFVVDFYATWCGPCKVLEPRLEKVVTDHNKKTKGDKDVKLAKVDIDQLEQLSGKYNVQAVPTVIAIKNGKEISRFTGAADENRIQKMLDQLSR